VFVGYSNQHKGYKCLDPFSGQVYLSRDVIFDETVFPFSSFPPMLCTAQDGVCVAEPTVTNDANLDHGVFEDLINLCIK
jgi:hypothetical protein